MPNEDELEISNKFDESKVFQKEVIAEYIRIELHQEPPWEEINKLLKEHGFPYHLNWGYPIESLKKEVFFTQKEGGSKLLLSDLSSGEKSALDLIARLFYFQGLSAQGEKKTDNIKRINIMLLDEPDRHLDPQFCKLFYKIVYNHFVKKHKIQMIMSTHKMDTVALAPKDSVFVMKSGKINCNRDDAVSRMESNFSLHQTTPRQATTNLTEGKMAVVSDTNYVCVENEDDAKFYSIIYKKLTLACFIKDNRTKLTFIPVGIKIIQTEKLIAMKESSTQLLRDFP